MTFSVCFSARPSVGGVGHALQDLHGEGGEADVQAAAGHQLPVPGGLHRAHGVPGHHGVALALNKQDPVPGLRPGT